MATQPLDDFFVGRDDDRHRAAALDFVDRCEAGPPQASDDAAGYTAEEAVHHYRTVAARLTPWEYEDAVNEAFDRLSYENRRQLKQVLRQRTSGRLDVQNDDPRDLAQATVCFREQDAGGDGLIALFGGGAGESESSANALATVALGGVAAVAIKKVLSRRAARPPQPQPAWIRRAKPASQFATLRP